MPVPDVDVEVVQTGCDVSVAIPGYGSLQCTAQPVGATPRLASCRSYLDWCPTIVSGLTGRLVDDGTKFTHEIWGRFGPNCDGSSVGGTMVFAVTLTPR